MAGNWSRIEVEAIVADYFSMLDSELRDEPYNKTDHRRALAALLNQRSDGSIERKHQNISAILIELGYPYINGYKPLGNYQSLLFDVASERITGNSQLSDAVAQSVVEPATMPSVDDILARFESPPDLATSTYRRVAEHPQARVLPTGTVNYLEREANNASLGRAGEEFALNYERERLRHHGKSAMADRVEHVSLTRGDGLGFDILSFEPDGRERLIEVKTTGYGKATPFFVSRNEVTVSRTRAPEYHLYRIFRFRTDPRLYSVAGALDKSCRLDPVEFEARVARRE